MAKKRRILLLDDNYASMKPLADALEALYGYEITLTAAASLLEQLKTEKFDLLIVDQMISTTSLDAEQAEVRNIHFDGVHWHRTGPEFVSRLRKGHFSAHDGQGTRADTPVIMLSAVADSSVSEADRKALEIADYMEKPFDLEDLSSRIKTIFEGK